MSDDEKKLRHAELQAIVDETNRDFTAKYLGQTLEVLVEGKEGDGFAAGHTASYTKVRFPAPLGPRRPACPRSPRHRWRATVGALGTLALSESDLSARLIAPKFDSVDLPMA